MRPATLSLSFLLISTAASAANIRFDPPNPTSRTAVTAHIVGNYSTCLPSVQQNGRIISIVLQNCGINNPAPTVDVPVDLGVSPAGVYDVVVGLPTILVGLAEGTLVVQDASPPFQVFPNVGHAGDQVAISGKDVLICAGGPSPPVCGGNAKFGGVPATVTGINDGQLVVRAPPHDPGPVDVTIEHAGTVRATAAFYYVPSAKALDPAFYEAVLFPVIFAGPGAFGSQWTTEVVLRNENDFPLALLPSSIFGRPAPRSTTKISGCTIAAGDLEFVPRQAMPNVHFGVLVRDLSHQAEALGTEIPVIRDRDFFGHPLELLNVPTDPRFRVSLRAYDIGPGTGLEMEIRPLESDEVLVSTFVFPVLGTLISDLVATYPQLAGKGPVRITLSPPIEGWPTLWGFVAVTNNATQHVTIISPQ